MHGIKLLGFYIGVHPAAHKTVEQASSSGDSPVSDTPPAMTTPTHVPLASSALATPTFIPPVPMAIPSPRFFSAVPQFHVPPHQNFSFHHPLNFNPHNVMDATSNVNMIAPPNLLGTVPPNHHLGIPNMPTYPHNVMPPPPNFNLNVITPPNGNVHVLGPPNMIAPIPNPNMIAPSNPIMMAPPDTSTLPPNGPPLEHPDSLLFSETQSLHYIDHSQPIADVEVTTPSQEQTNGDDDQKEVVNPFKEAAMILANIKDVSTISDPAGNAEDSTNNNSSTLMPNQFLGKLMDYYKHREQLK